MERIRRPFGTRLAWVYPCDRLIIMGVSALAPARQARPGGSATLKTLNPPVDLGDPEFLQFWIFDFEFWIRKTHLVVLAAFVANHRRPGMSPKSKIENPRWGTIQ